jgi:WD40 repeat protein
MFTAHPGGDSRSAVLADALLRSAAIVRARTLSSVFLATVLLSAGSGLLAYQALKPGQDRVEQPVAPAAAIQDATQQESGKAGPRTDRWGDPLPAEALARLGTVRFRSGHGFDSLVFTPDGRFLVSGGCDGAVVWDPATGKEIRRMGSSGAQPWAAPISADGKYVAVICGDDNKAGGIYELATGRQVCRFGKRYEGAAPVCFSPDGTTLAVATGNGLCLYDPHTGSEQHRLRDFDSVVPGLNGCVTFAPQGHTLIYAGAGGVIRYRDAQTAKKVRQIRAAVESVGEMVLSPDGTRLAYVALTQVKMVGQTAFFPATRVHVCDATSGKELYVATVPGEDAHLVNAKPGERYHVGPAGMIFARDSKTLWLVASNHRLYVWDAATGKEVRQYGGEVGGLGALAFAPDGKSFAIADAYHSIRIRDVASGRDKTPVIGHRGQLRAVAISPDGRTAATAGDDAEVFLWDPHRGQELRHLSGHTSWVSALAFSPDARTLFSTSNDKTIRAWDLTTGAEWHRHTVKQYLYWLQVSPDGKTVVAPGPDNDLAVLDGSLHPLRSLKGLDETMLVGAGFSHDGRRLSAASVKGALCTWDLTLGTQRRGQVYAPAEQYGRKFALSPNDRCAAVAFDDTVRFVDL